MRPFTLLLACISLLLASCIGDDILDDFVEPVVRISNPIDTLAVGESFQFEAMFLDNVGMPQTATPSWQSSDPSIITVDPSGRAEALNPGAVDITATVTFEGSDYSDQFPLVAGAATVQAPSERNGVIMTTSFYTLEGDFVLREMPGGNLQLEVADNYRASSALPGLYIYLTNNPNSTAQALEIGEVTVFEGAHSYEIPNTGLNQFEYILYFCKPFSVKVGEGNFND